MNDNDYQDIPVLLIVFNRPEMTARVMDALRIVKPKRLLVAADAPRASRPQEVRLCAGVREVIERLCDWPCEVQWKCSDKNLGCKYGPATAIAWGLAQYEEIVILEDDCVPHPDFFVFVRGMLDRYRDDPRVMLVSGLNVLRGHCDVPFSYGFSRYPLTWGWATWRRAWNHFDLDMNDWPSIRDSGLLVDLLGNQREAQYWTRNLELAMNDEIDAWDYQLHLAMWINGMHAIYPAANLVKNIGIEGTHFSSARPMHNIPYGVLENPLRHPPIVYRDPAADAIIRQTWYLPSFGQRVRGKVHRMAKRCLRVGRQPKLAFPHSTQESAGIARQHV